MIVPMQRAHAAHMAELHIAALAGDFLPSLGKGFLTVFYQGVFDLGVGFGYEAIEGGQPVGFILGSADMTSLFRRVIMRRAIPLGLHVIPSVLRKPALVANVLETFLYPNKEGKNPETAELVVIGLDVDYRGRGLGRQLVNALNATFRAHGVQSYRVAVLQSNEGANNFYRRLGFQHALEFELYRKKWNLYTYTIK